MPKIVVLLIFQGTQIRNWVLNLWHEDHMWPFATCVAAPGSQWSLMGVEALNYIVVPMVLIFDSLM